MKRTVCRRAGLLLAFILPLAGCWGQPPLKPLPADAAILAFGDSLTYGTGAGPGQSYPEILAGLINRRIVGSGVPGETTREGLLRLAGVLDRERPALVLLCEGGNDFLQRVDQARTMDNLRAMIRLIQARGSQVVLIGVPRPGWGLAAADFYDDLGAELAIPVDNETLERVLASDSLKSDLIHPNAAGYREMARAVADLLRSAGAL